MSLLGTCSEASKVCGRQELHGIHRLVVFLPVACISKASFSVIRLQEIVGIPS